MWNAGAPPVELARRIIADGIVGGRIAIALQEAFALRFSETIGVSGWISGELADEQLNELLGRGLVAAAARGFADD